MEILGLDLEELELVQIGNWPPFLRGIVVGVFAIATLFLGYLSALSPQMDDCRQLIQKIELSKIEFSEAQFQASNLDAYRKEVKIVEEQLTSLSEELPSQNELAGFLDDASQQAASSGVKLIAIQPLRDTSKGFYSETEMALKLIGDYNSLAAFVSNIANMKRIVTIHDFKIKRSDGSDENAEKGALEFDLSSKTYWAGRDKSIK